MYEGEWQKIGGRVRRHGRGKHTDGSFSYDGEWRNDKLCGQVTLRLATGESYKGEMEDNTYHGTGVYMWNDGASYSGSWSRSKMHGAGVFCGTDSVKWQGEFRNGAFYNGKAWVDVRST